MEAIKDQLNQIQNGQMQTLSQNQPISTQTIPLEQHAALFSIINQSRLIQGWNASTAKDLNEQIIVWAKILNRYQIPFDAYEELLNRAIDLRAAKLNQGQEVPFFSAELLIACWTGEHGLQRERYSQKVDESKAILPAHYPTKEEISAEVGQDFGVWLAEKVEEGKQKMREKLKESEKQWK